ncbi:transposase, MuDR, MULE transposase domain protein [Tanacetum coccineum]|uniref:Transposase, MuDR, MULE transposase domain protein n=1 Tax=Tanacetum coccineum TaxID=301880 RepID=A0ABQ5H0H1_9ASTR
MDIESILCPLCEKNVESSSHIFFTCPIPREIFRKVLLWWEIDVVMVSSYDEWFSELEVVAVIKSATPNALGDMTDPKGTVSGTIHHKVLTEAEFGKGICAGSALILHNVSVFSPKPSAHYLNITKRNLVKVFYKDGGSSQKQTLIVDTAPGSGRGTQMSGSAFSLERGAEGFSDAIRRNTDNNQNMHIDDEQENLNPVSSIGQQCSKTSNEETNQNTLTDEEMLTIADAIENHENVTRPTDGIKNGQPTVSASLPLWTDEQLDELLDADFDDLP